mgnify:CR=1 FL=1
MSGGAPAGEGGGGHVIKINLIPMIDMLFNFILFFMCVTEMSKSDKAQMVLPRAECSVPDVVVPGRLTLNVCPNRQNPDVVDVITGGHEVSDEELNNILRDEAALSRMNSPDGLPTRYVVIRADKGIEYQNVYYVMAACMKWKLWRIAFATKDPKAPN